MIQPFSRLACARTASIFCATSGSRPDKDFVRHADIGTPIDVDVRAVDGLEGLLSVKHDDHAIGVVRKSFRQLAPGRDVNGFADAIERDPVFRRQRLHAGDAWNHVIFERDVAFGLDRLDDPQGAVVERWVAPNQERTAFSLAKFLQSATFRSLARFENASPGRSVYSRTRPWSALASGN
jgi:hypothetical protein